MAGGTGNGGFEPPASPAAPVQAAPVPSTANGSTLAARGGQGTGGFDTSPGSTPAPGKTITYGAPAKSGGGFWGDLGSVGHFISSRLATGYGTVKSIGTGLYDAGKAGVIDPWWNTITKGHPYAGNTGQNIDKQTGALLGGTIVGPVNAVKDIGSGKFKDPIGDLIMLSPAGHGIARAGLGVGDAAATLRAGEGVGAAAKALKSPELLSTPRLVGQPGREPVSLYASQNAARRVVQAGIDKVVNKALANDRAKGILGNEGPVAKYGNARMSGTVADYTRAAVRYRQAMIATTRVAGRGVSQFAKSIKTDVLDPQLTAQALLHSLHDNVLPEHEAILHEQKAAEGINPEQNKAWAQAFSDAAKLNAVHLTEDNRVAINEGHPLTAPLLRADNALEKLGAYAEHQIVVRGLRDPLELADRRGRVAQLVQRGQPLLGKEPQVLTDARRSLNKALQAHSNNLEGEAKWRSGSGQKTMEGARVPTSPNPQNLYTEINGKRVPLENSNPWRDRVVQSGQKVEDARSRVLQLEDRHGLSSPERRAAQAQGIAAREQLAFEAHRLFGDEAQHHLAQIEGFARQWARVTDRKPEEWYAQFLRDTQMHPDASSAGDLRLSEENAQPETILHEALHAVRQSLSPTISEIARRLYAPHGWDRAGEERFVEDMGRAARGEEVSPEAQRLFQMTHQYTPGRGYVPMSIYEDARQAHSPMAAAQSPIVGLTKQPLETHFATGEATAQGLRRTDVAEAVTAHVQKLFRFFNTLDHRELAAKYGGDTWMSKGDVLVRYDRRTEGGFKLPAAKVGPALKETLGILENKTALPAPEEEGLSAGVAAVLHDFLGDVFPGHFAPHTEVTLEDGTATTAGHLEATATRGTKAPAGYKWVPQEIARLKDLESTITRGDPNVVGRFADNVNGAITAATVYYKIGHFFTRYLTNASANILQGSAAPWQIARSVQLWHALSEDERQQALAYAGTHYYEAAPGATGGSFIGKGMQKGLHVPFTDIALRTRSGEAVMSPQFWAHHVDSPFRFNSIAFEARQAGYDGVEGFQRFLQDVKDYNALEPADRARVDGVLRRADREAIAYDRMNQFEKKWISRIIWFYPWVKGSTVFTANSWLEHPFKSAALYGYGEQGAQQRDKVLGDLPSYAQGLTPLAHGSEPIVSDFNTFNPWSTAADLMDIPAHLRGAAGMANPFYGFALNTAEGVNGYGVPTKTPITDNLKSLLSSTPEFQIEQGATNTGDQSHKLYPGGHGLDPFYKNWLGELVRSLGGPATPRHVNPLAGHSLAQRERTGR